MRVFRQHYKDRAGKSRQSRKWYVEFADALGRSQRLPGFTDKAQTKELGRNVERLTAVCVNRSVVPTDLSQWLESLPREIRNRLARYGLLDSLNVANAKPLAEHLDDFQANLRDKGRTEEHCRTVTNRARRVFKECSFVFIEDVSASRVQRFLAELKNAGSSQQSVNHYLSAAKQVCRWLVTNRRASENRLDGMEGGNVKLDVRRERRELSGEEIRWLLKATNAEPVRSRLTGQQRVVLYSVALSTGLRASECASLTPAHFDLTADPPTVRIDAGDEKARRGASLPLPPDVRELLREYVRNLASDAPQWPGRWAAYKQAGQFLKRDLVAARTAWLKSLADTDRDTAGRSDFLLYEDGEGRFADFHALRHTYLSRLGRSGASPKVMQKLARHSTVELTLGRYTHANLHDLTAAVEGLPPLSPPESPESERATIRATGTDDARANDSDSDNAAGSVLPDVLPAQTAFGGDSVRFPASEGELVSIPFRLPDDTKKAREPRKNRSNRADSNQAERVGFEPTVPCRTLVFETSTIGHSVTSPNEGG
jgi:site-specific recombinase XerD